MFSWTTDTLTGTPAATLDAIRTDVDARGHGRREHVVPTDRLVAVELEIREIRDRTVFATAWLWVDGRRIYRVARLGARMVA